jgi:hypothetical protein
MMGLIGFTNAGKILFYIPFASKSIKITFMPLVEEMAMYIKFI